jgi:Icc-related predicted phosphoesterase
MIIASISDLESLTEDLTPLKDILQEIKKPDLFLFAGDLYDYRKPDQYKEIICLLKKQKIDCPIIAVFGNREFPEDEDKIRKYAGKAIRFLEDEAVILKIKNKTIGIVGSRGCLDKPTFWQMKSLPQIWQKYKERFHNLSDLLKNLDADIKILLTHYAPTYKTLRGEDPNVYPGLGSKYFEKVLIETKTTLAIHGHAEIGIPLAFVDSIPVFNVAYPVNRKIVLIDTDKLPKKS